MWPERSARRPRSRRDDRLRQGFAETDVAFDVLDDDCAVVDQDADGQRKAAERHGVQRLSAGIHHQHGGDDRQRNGRKNDQSQPPIAEKQQDHQRGQARGHHAAHLHARERGIDEDRLIEDRLDGDAARA